MATNAPLLGKEKKGHSKASIFYGADEYLEELKKKYAHDHEIAALKNALPGEGDPNAAGVAASQDKMLKVEKDSANRSLKTNRLFPTANKPDPMPQNLAFLFTKITPEQAWLFLSLCFILILCGLSDDLHVERVDGDFHNPSPDDHRVLCRFGLLPRALVDVHSSLWRAFLLHCHPADLH